MTQPMKLEPYNDWPNDIGFDVQHEERTPVELVVTGHIPTYAAGTLYRTGPGGYEVDTEHETKFSMSHWFDGFTQIHRFRIIALDPSNPTSQVRVEYNSRHSVDALIESIRKTGDLAGSSFGQKRDICQSVFGKVQSNFVPPPADPTALWNVGVTLSINPPGLGESVVGATGIQSLWANTDAAMHRQLDPTTLEPIGYAMQTKLLPELTGSLSAAHARKDPINGDFYNYNLEIGQNETATYRVFRASPSTGKTEILATIADAPAAYLHSLILTENYVVLCVWGGRYESGGAKMAVTRNFVDAMKDLDPNDPNLWYVIDRKSGKGVVSKYEGAAFFCFHTINAWEEPSRSDPSQVDIVADLSAYENLDVIKRLYYDNIKSTSPSALEYAGEKGASTRPSINRWRLPSVGTSSDRALLEFTAPRHKSCDLPTLNPRYATKPSRYIYGAIDRGLSTFYDGLIKYDTSTHDAVYWSKHGHSAGEAIFVPNPGGGREDDGVLLSVVLDGQQGKSYLLVLDATTMEEVGRASMDWAVGFGFHGAHRGDEKGSQQEALKI